MNDIKESEVERMVRDKMAEMELDAEYDYNMEIKRRLSKWRDDFRERVGADLNFSAVAEKMQNKYGLKTSTQKVAEMFNTQSRREVKLQELAALTHMLNIPLHELARFPNEPAIDPEFNWCTRTRKQAAERGIRQLKNEFYNGEYFGYFFAPKHRDSMDIGGKGPVEGYEIEEVVLRIKESNGDTVIEMEELTSHHDFYGVKELDHFILTGTLYLLGHTNIAYSFVSDPAARRNIAIMFEYKEFSKDILYYRTAAIMMPSLNERRTPLFQKMAMFRVRQDLTDAQNQDIIRGILALNTNPVMIDAAAFETMCAEDPELKKLLPADAKSYYVFSEPAIRNSSISWSSQSMERLLKLRKKACFAAHEIVLEPEYHRDFIKALQQEQLRKRKNPAESDK